MRFVQLIRYSNGAGPYFFLAMNTLDGTYDGGGDGQDDFNGEEFDHSGEDGGDGYGFEYPQQEDYSNDAEDFENHQLGLDNDIDYGGDYD